MAQAATWKVVGVENFKGRDYIKLERVDETTNPFSKKFANISREQMKALFEGMEMADLLDFAGAKIE